MVFVPLELSHAVPHAWFFEKKRTVDSSNRTLQEALRLAIDALGGMKVVGSSLKPEMDPVLAREWLNHCLTSGRRERITLEQVAWIFRQAKAAGSHSGFEALAQALGYRVTAVIDEREAIADLARQVKHMAAETSALSEEMLARAHALHLKVFE